MHKAEVLNFEFIKSWSLQVICTPLFGDYFLAKIGPEREVGGSSLTNQFRKEVFDGLSMSLGSMKEELTLNICLLS